MIFKPDITAPDGPYAQQVLAALAWALKHQISLPEVLRALPFVSRKGFKHSVGWFGQLRGRRSHFWWLAVLIASPWLLFTEETRSSFGLVIFLALLVPLILPPRSWFWSRRVHAIIDRIESGEPLHLCLGKEPWSPSFIAAVKQLEEEGRLAAGFAKLVEHERWLDGRRPVESFLPLAFLQVGFLAACLAVALALLDRLFINALSEPPLFIHFLVWVPFGFLLFGLLLYPRKLGASVRRSLPFFRRVQAARDLERATARLLLHGSVTPLCDKSAEAAANHIEGRWLAIRLHRFADDLAAGHPWAESWEKARIGPRRLRSLAAAFAASGMAPQAILSRIHALAAEDVARHTRWLHRWSAPLMILPVIAFAGWAWWELVNGLVEALGEFPEAW